MGRPRSENEKTIKFVFYPILQSNLIEVNEDDTLHQPVSSIMTLNPTTHKYETPPPRWFNKETGEYEDVKPMYFVDPNNPTLGMVVSGRVTQEDAAFRQFLLDKEERRRIRIQREAEETARACLATLDAPALPSLKSHKLKEKYNALAEPFEDELAQKSFREITGRMFSKKVATAFHGPSEEKEEQQRRELEQRYSALKPLAPSDAMIEKLPPPVDTQAILEAWKQSAAIRAKPKITRTARSEAERVRALIKNKSGLKTGYTFAAMKGSYIPPNSSIALPNGDGWTNSVIFEPRKPESREEDDLMEKGVGPWGKEQLRNEVWWDRSTREEGRLALNPITGKLEDRGGPITSKTVEQAQLKTQGIFALPGIVNDCSIYGFADAGIHYRWFRFSAGRKRITSDEFLLH
jgi:hypothetical protein